MLMAQNEALALAQKWERFYNAKKQGIAMIQVRSIANERMLGPGRKLNFWQFPEQMEAYLEYRVAGERFYWNNRLCVKDDSFPTIVPTYGIAEHTAYLGGEVVLQEDTSYHKPILTEWADFDKLSLDENRPWLRMLVDGIAYYRKNWGQLFNARIRGGSGVSDIANVVRGNELFMDVYDHPEMVRKLADFCADACRFATEQQKAVCEPIGNGFVNGFDMWMPKNSIGHISEDAACMLSVESFDSLFMPSLRRLCDGYDNVMLHIHALSRKNIPQFASVPQITVMEITGDPNQPPSIAVAREYEEVLRKKMVIVRMRRETLRQHLDFFDRMKTIIWYDAQSIEDAQEASELIHSRYSDF